jgi:O-acetyl-ADP-ribose deacetylase (regulator of RNase III)
VTPGLARIVIVDGDITKLEVDAIVNAANSALSGGGGVDGAIHRAAGPELLAECRTLGRCPTGEARLTKGYKLRARYVIHAVGPVWRGGESGEPAQLASCYRTSLALARDNAIESIAFPGISTGIYGYPARPAAALAIATIADELSRHELPRKVILCMFGADATEIADEALATARART